ncbi:glutamine-hydrolyzing carbamoyl-phosphate synthase small subunit [Candidatus Microgenomates bacterium]|nr:glutamine-hydrolyzing carbamoyl-phosphate synthase small subunit [Candidatus Microgenomates bacterium]
MTGKLVLEDGSVFIGESFGANIPSSGELVFSTGMVGYPESLTDPSYCGQILILTYPLVGNYGVPAKASWESGGIKVWGLVVSNYIDTPSHSQSKMTLSAWLKSEKIPALEIADTRLLAQKIREKGTMLGKIVFNKDTDFYDPNKENLIKIVSKKTVLIEGMSGKKHKKVLLIDCGVKESIKRCLLKRRIQLIQVPADYDPFSGGQNFDGIVVSNGPGDPKMARTAIQTIKTGLKKRIPTLGICLGHQILALASGGDTYKLKFGHRSQNQPCVLVDTPRCFITSQNHGFAVGKIPPGFKNWFINANDGSNEGIIHKSGLFMSAQFHPEANPGPFDTEWIFDFFLSKLD